ncbi:MAG: hypothetical protein ABI663_10755 [Chryseolinea sp.]
MNVLTIGIVFIILYFAFYHVVERRRIYRRNLSVREVPKSYLSGIYIQLKEEFIISIVWIFLVLGIFMCLSCVLMETM